MKIVDRRIKPNAVNIETLRDYLHFEWKGRYYTFNRKAEFHVKATEIITSKEQCIPTGTKAVPVKRELHIVEYNR